MLTLSPLQHTWIIDLDGTIVKHNGYKTHGFDILLEDAKNFWMQIPEEDFILILTARTEEYRLKTENFLYQNGLRYDKILFNVPLGERVVINDQKPSGLDMAIAINKERDAACSIKININTAL